MGATRSAITSFVIEKLLTSAWTAILSGAGMTAWAWFSESGPYAVTLGLVSWAAVQAGLSHLPEARQRLSARREAKGRRRYLLKKLAQGEEMYGILSHAVQAQNARQHVTVLGELDEWYGQVEKTLAAISPGKKVRFLSPANWREERYFHQTPEALRARLDALMEIIRDLDLERFPLP